MRAAILLVFIMHFALSEIEGLNFRGYYCIMTFSKNKDALLDKFTKTIIPQFSNTTDIQNLSNQFMLTVFNDCFHQMENYSDFDVYTMIFRTANNVTLDESTPRLNIELNFISELRKPNIDDELKRVANEIQKIQSFPQVCLLGRIKCYF